MQPYALLRDASYFALARRMRPFLTPANMPCASLMACLSHCTSVLGPGTSKAG